jgi:glycosyltransferase involved in cell wall biosynthesis
MTFSIAIPVHNGEAILAQTIASVVHQKRPTDEILVVDDKSTGNSRNNIAEFQMWYLIRYEYNEQPISDARNRVVASSRSDYVTIFHRKPCRKPRCCGNTHGGYDNRDHR